MRIIRVYNNEKLTTIIVQSKRFKGEITLVLNDDNINVSIPQLNDIDEVENILMGLIEKDIYHNVEFKVYYALKQVICNASIEYGLEVAIKY